MTDVMLLNANALAIPLADRSVQMVATSPPYYGLRSYGIGVDNGEIGLEPTPEEYVSNLVQVFREVRRVLRDDGCVFLNLGDSYSGSGRGANPNGKQGTNKGTYFEPENSGDVPNGLKPKDLIGIPWRVAFALQADGWWLRSDIIWAKPNPMPESVTDRPTKAHEYIFLLTKSSRYFWDALAVREEFSDERNGNPGKYVSKLLGSKDTTLRNDTDRIGKGWNASGEHTGRNLRTVWNIATTPYKGAHFATWPPKLVEPMIKAGSKIGDIVLDPFAGSGTTLMVARQLGRHAVGIDLSYPYLHDQARRRLELDKLAAWSKNAEYTD